MANADTRTWLAAALGALVLTAGCNEPQSPKLNADLFAPGGAVSVAATTSGSDVDPDGYVARMDVSSVQHVDANGIVTFSGLAGGDHRVDHFGAAGNCWAMGNDPRTVSVTGGLAGATRFDVGCVAEGGAYVRDTTTGVDLDPDGYAVTVDGTASRPLATNDGVWFNGLSSYGSHTVAVSGVTPNCTVSGANPRIFTVTSGGTTPIAFSVSCTPTGSGTGTVTVKTSTTGVNLDPDGYTVTIDGTTSQGVAANGTVNFTAAAGAHPVALTGIAANCTVSGGNPRTVSVPAGGKATTTFALACGAAPPVEIVGAGQLKMGSPTKGNFVQSFAADVRADGTGRFTFTDWSDIHPSGAAGTIVTDPAADPATSFTWIHTSSSACTDPSRGFEFEAVGREDEGTLRSYTVELCDNGAAGSGVDFLSIYCAFEQYGRSGIVTSGDLAKR